VNRHPCRRIVGVHLSQPRYLRLGVPHQRHQRKYLAADPRPGDQPVVVAGQVGSLMGEDRVQLGGIEDLHRASGQDHGRIPAGDTVGGRLGLFHQHGPEGGLGIADQPRGLRVLQRLAQQRSVVRAYLEREMGERRIVASLTLDAIVALTPPPTITNRISQRFKAACRFSRQAASAGLTGCILSFAAITLLRTGSGRSGKPSASARVPTAPTRDGPVERTTLTIRDSRHVCYHERLLRPAALRR
jgi:hypothetical protein